MSLSLPQFGIFADKPFTLGPGGRLRFDAPGLEEGQTADAIISIRFEPYQPENVYRVVAVHITGDARLRGEVPKAKLKAGETLEIPIVWIGRHQTITNIKNLEAQIEIEGVVESYG